jgi:hypothetical protein
LRDRCSVTVEPGKCRGGERLRHKNGRCPVAATYIRHASAPLELLLDTVERHDPRPDQERGIRAPEESLGAFEPRVVLVPSKSVTGPEPFGNHRFGADGGQDRLEAAPPCGTEPIRLPAPPPARGVRSDRSRGRTRHSLRRQQRAATRLRSAMTTAPAPDAGDIPMAATSFVGREREVDRIRSLLAESRLLTLTGPGGIGKTRLAIEAARQSARRCTGGLFVVELASIRDPNQVLPQRCGECPAGRDSDPPGYRHQPHSAASRWRAGVRGRATRAADARAARSQPSPDRIGGALPRAPTGASDT